MRLRTGVGMAILMLAGAALAHPEQGGPVPEHPGPIMMMHNSMMGGPDPSEPGPIPPGQDAFGAVNEIIRGLGFIGVMASGVIIRCIT